MTLNLSKVPIVKKGIKTTRAEQEGVLKDVYDELERMGVTMSSDGPPAQPPDLTKYEDFDAITTAQLGAMHLSYAGYIAYLSTKLAEVRVAEDASKRTLDKLVSESTLDLVAKGMPKGETMHAIRGSEAFRIAELTYFKYSAMHKLLQAKVDGYEAQAAAVSRLITIRTSEQDLVGRDGRMANRGRKTHFSGAFNAGRKTR